jgi:hypothetical protein
VQTRQGAAAQLKLLLRNRGLLQHVAGVQEQDEPARLRRLQQRVIVGHLTRGHRLPLRRVRGCVVVHAARQIDDLGSVVEINNVCLTCTYMIVYG